MQAVLYREAQAGQLRTAQQKVEPRAMEGSMSFELVCWRTIWADRQVDAPGNDHPVSGVAGRRVIGQILN